MADVHPEFSRHGSFAHLKLGKLPARPAAKTVRLADYLDEQALPAIPETCDWTAKVPVWPMYGNDELGDCTCAAAGHMIQAWTAEAGVQHAPANADVEALYWQTGDPPTATGQPGCPIDTGRVETDILDYWHTQGLGGDRIAGYAAVDPGHIRAGIFLFGGVYTGLQLPLTAQTQPVWDLVETTGDGQPGSWGGHAVPWLAYTPTGYTCVTWGATHPLTGRFAAAYTDEVYAIVSPDWLNAGKTVSGLDIEQLTADLAAL